MKILSWNIEKFTNAKLQNFVNDPSGHWTKKAKIMLPAANRLTYMQRTFTAATLLINNVPDVIAVLEVLADPALALGNPLDAPHSIGIINLLNQVKAWTGNATWRLVPPLKCNPANAPIGPNVQHEVVGVLYDSTRVTFRGPVAHPAAYPAPWNNALITGAPVVSGQIRFFDAMGNEIDFPANYHRRPFLVDFQENFGALRRIRCLFSHTSPGFHVGGTQSIAQIQEMAPAAGPNAPDLCVAAGDFNVNDWNLAQSAASYAPLLGVNYVKQLGTADQSTHFIRKTAAKPNALFDYMQQEVIDNFLVRPTPPGVLPVMRHAAVNEVAGAPAPYITAMANTLAALNALPPGTVPGKIARFRQWQNFWCIVATSDHAPIFLEI